MASLFPTLRESERDQIVMVQPQHRSSLLATCRHWAMGREFSPLSTGFSAAAVPPRTAELSGAAGRARRGATGWPGAGGGH